MSTPAYNPHLSAPYVPTLYHPDPQHLGDGRLLFGTGAPPSTLGNNGDYYTNLTTGDVYIRYGDTWNINTGGGGGTANATGHGSPTGVRTPAAVGQFYTDLDAPALYQATGLTNTSWSIQWI